MINVIVFMVASMMVTAHVFFLSVMSSETNALQVRAMQNRFRFDRALNAVLNDIQDGKITGNSTPPKAAIDTHDVLNTINIDGNIPCDDYEAFYEAAKLREYDFTDDIHACVYDLLYKYVDNYGLAATGTNWGSVVKHERAFPPMNDDGARYFLIRVYRTPQDVNQKRLMYQGLVKRTGSGNPYTVKLLSLKEVWYEK